MTSRHLAVRCCLAIGLAASVGGACDGQSESRPHEVDDAATDAGAVSDSSSSSGSSSDSSSGSEEDAATAYDAGPGAEVPGCFAAREFVGTANVTSCIVCAIRYCATAGTLVGSECSSFLQCLCPPAPPPQPGQCEPELQDPCVHAVTDYNACVFNSPCGAACGYDAGY